MVPPFLSLSRMIVTATLDATRSSLDLADGRVLSARRFGDGAPRVVFAHGAGLNAHTWDRTIAALGAPALALDLPGHGDSSWRDDADYSPSALAPDIAAAIDRWADGPVVLVGHSLGGLATIAVAAARPEIVAHLVLVDILPGIAGPDGSSSLTKFYERLEFASIDDALDHAAAFGLGGSRENARRGVERNTRVRADGVVEWKHHIARLLSPSVPDAAPHVRSVTADDLAAVAAPISLVAGTRGYLADRDLAAFRSAHPAAEVAVLDAPHNVHETRYAELAHLLRPHVAAA